MTISNYVDKAKLKYDDIQNLVMAEEVRRKDLVNSRVRNLP